MANGKVDYSELESLKKQIEQSLGANMVDEFITACAKELAARLLAKVIKRTPVGVYPKSSGKKGGTLRRGWTGGQNKNATAYASGLTVHHFGNAYVIEVVNPIEYAPYVEYGHRTANHAGWVEGKFFLTISEEELKKQAPKILENKLKKKLKECFG